MQWFIGINEGCPAWPHYADLARVAIHTALLHTSLRPLCLYDGKENEFTHWLKRRGVRIIPCRTFLHDDLARLGERRQNPELLSATLGVFLRVELPSLQRQYGFDDRVLYTDCDVIFRQEVVDDFAPREPRYFAVAVEGNRENLEEVNTGVMWMNLPEMAKLDPAFRTYLRENIDGLPAISWDQGALKNFYRSPEGAPLWDLLPPELNWKPYWEDYSHAKIIHFHGPKPFQRPYIDGFFKELKFLSGGRWNELCDLWEELLRDAH